MRDKKLGSRIFDVSNIVLLIFISACFLIPFMIILFTSVATKLDITQRGPYILFPKTFQLDYYKQILYVGSPVFQGYKITLFRITVGTSLNLVVTAALAYGLSKRNLPMIRIFTVFVFFTMFFNGGLIPTYLVVKLTGLSNRIWALVIPMLVNTWNLLVMRTFFMQLPESLEESAIIDGASHLQVFIKIIIPLSLPAFATIGLFYAVAHWNSWFDAAIYINDQSKMPVQNIMRNIVVTMNEQNDDFLMMNDNPPPAEALKSTVIIVSTLPILVVYPFIQKYFVKGVMVGAIKG